MEELNEQIRLFGSLVFTASNQDAEKAANTLKKLNGLISENPEVVETITNGDVIEKAIKFSKNPMVAGLFARFS